MEDIASGFKNAALLDVFKGSAASALLFLASSLFVVPGPAAGLFAPFPLLYYSVKDGRKAGILITAITAGIIFTINQAGSIVYLLQCGLLSLLLAEFLRSNKGLMKSLCFASAINGSLVLVVAAIFSWFHGGGLDSNVGIWLNQVVTEVQSHLVQSGFEGQELEAMRSQVKWLQETAGLVYPFLVFTGFVVVGGLNLLLLKKFVHKLSKKTFFGDFTAFRNHDYLIWVGITAGFTFLLGKDPFTRIALNLLCIVILLYFVQGLAIAASFFHKFRISGLVKVVFYILMLLQPYLAALVATVGLFDLWCDFRTPRKQENL